MPSYYEYAVMCGQVYEQKGGIPPKGWKIIEYVEDHGEDDQNDKHGFKAVAYQKDNDIVVAFRGTWVTSNLKTDLQLLFKRLPNTMKFAYEFLRRLESQYPKACFHLTGHSLGGALAEILSCAYSFKKALIEVITFESPGTKNYLEQLPNKAKIISFLTAPNAINTCNEHAAENLFRLYIPHVDGLTVRHFISCIWGSASRAVTFFGPVKNGLKVGCQTVLSTIKPNISLNVSSHLISPNVFSLYTGAKVSQFLVGASVGSIGGISVSTAIGAIAGALPGLIEDGFWIKRQHSMDNILACFDPSTGDVLPGKSSEIISWPTKIQHNITSMLKKEIISLIPFHEANKGIHNLMRENEVVEAQILQMDGYKVQKLVKEALYFNFKI